MYELFEHTADLGLRVRAERLETLFEEAALCMFSAIIEDPLTVQPTEERTLTIPGTDHEYLLFDWLRELLYRFETEMWLLSRSTVEVSETALTATIWGERFDPARHGLSHEVKAITYHDLTVAQQADGWLAEVIVDI